MPRPYAAAPALAVACALSRRTKEEESDTGVKRVINNEKGVHFDDFRTAWEKETDVTSDTKRDVASNQTSEGVYSYSYVRDRKSTKTSVTPDTKALFRHMRAEFQAEEDVMDTSTTESTVTQMHAPSAAVVERDVKDVGAPPVGVSAAKIVTWMVTFPMFVLKHVVVPTFDIASVMWYDAKLALSNARQAPSDDFFERESEWTRKETMNEDATIGLSSEERQVAEVQQVARNVVSGVEHVVRGVIRQFDIF